MGYKKGNILAYCYPNGAPQYIFEFVEIQVRRYQDNILTGLCINMVTDDIRDSTYLPLRKEVIRFASFVEIAYYRKHHTPSILIDQLPIYGT